MSAPKPSYSESDQEHRALLLESHPLSHSRQVEARFYQDKPAEPPLFVVIDGVSYRRDERQKYHMLGHQITDLEAKFLREYGPACFDAMYAIRSLEEQQEEDNRDLVERRMLDMFPDYPKVIGWVMGYEELEIGDLPPGARAKMPRE